MEVAHSTSRRCGGDQGNNYKIENFKVRSPYPLNPSFHSSIDEVVNGRVLEEQLRALAEDFLADERISDDLILHVIERLNSDDNNKSFCVSLTRACAGEWSEEVIS